MEKTYHAFISYRHTPRDIRVAEDVQRQLEHMRIPEDIQEKTGIRKIAPIFRDKSELPVTSSLTDEICRALADSRYLIVICSPEAAESEWVAREIRLFLETHGPEDVLTVLSKGEPQDVIPEALLTKKLIQLQEDGETIVAEDTVEPLSCDYRMPISQARRKELPRLAAAILGCRYDDLVRRAEQHRMKRLRMIVSAVSIASLTAISYLLWSNNRIRENYRQSQINESRYLAEASEKALEGNDRIEAIRLALQALPDRDNDRPVLAEAEYALANATGVYRYSGGLDYSAIKLYRTKGNIINSFVDPSKHYMTAIDSNETVYIWNLRTDALMRTIQAGDFAEIYPGGKEGFYIVNERQILKCKWETGETLWENDFPSFYHCFDYCEETGQAAAIGLEGICVIGPDGTTINQIRLPETYCLSVNNIYLANDEKHAVLTVEDIDSESYEAVLVDLKTGSKTVLKRDIAYLFDVLFTIDGKILLVESGNDKYNIPGRTSYNSLTLYKTPVYITAYDPVSCMMIWQKSVTYTQGGKRLFHFHESENNLLLCTLANRQFLLNTDDGTVIQDTEWPSPVVQISNFNLNSITCILENGSIGHYEKNPGNYYVIIPTFLDKISEADKYRNEENEEYGMMIHQEVKPYIIKYVRNVSAPGIQEYKKILFESSVYSSVINGNTVAVKHYNYDSSECAVSVYDLSSEERLFTRDFDWKSDTQEYGLTKNADSVYLINAYMNRINIQKTNLTTKKEETITLPQSFDHAREVFFRQKGNTINYLFTILYTEDEKAWNALYSGTYDADTGVWQEKELWKGSTLPDIEKVIVSDNGKYSLIISPDKTGGGYKLLMVNYENAGKRPEMVCTVNDEDFLAVINDTASRIAVINEQTLTVYENKGRELAAFKAEDVLYRSASFYRDELYVLNSHGEVIRYDKDLREVCRYEVAVPDATSFPDISVTWEFSQNTLYLCVGGIFSILELDQAQLKTYITEVIGIDIPNSRVIMKPADTSDTGLSVCHLYSTEELIQLGQDILSEAE